MDSTASDEAERRFHEAACGLVTFAPDGAILEANDTLASWLGTTASELRGTSFFDLLDPSSRFAFAERHEGMLSREGAIEDLGVALRSRDGATIPAMLEAVVRGDRSHAIVRAALLRTARRAHHEQELDRARKRAEASEARVRILQDVSGAFSASANDTEVAEAFVRVAREAFAATDVSVLLFDESRELHLVAGSNPLWGVVTPILELRETAEELVLAVDDIGTVFPELAEALRDAHRDVISVTPLIAEGERLGVLVCLFHGAPPFDEDLLDLHRALGRHASDSIVRVRLQRRLERLALHDPLTGVSNRQLVEQSLANALHEAEERGDTLSVVFLDVDDFKSINDALGHATGDEVLRALASRLRGAVRGDDVVGRIGGDEFVVICPRTDATGARAIAERIRERCRSQLVTTRGIVQVSVSVGLAVHTPGGEEPVTPTQLLIRADGAMYASKAAGKDRVSIEAR